MKYSEKLPSKWVMKFKESYSFKIEKFYLGNLPISESDYLKITHPL